MNWNIKDIESLQEGIAAAIADTVKRIKGHTVYFVDFDGVFGYSALVYANGRHIYYANDYQLHHPGKNRSELESYYTESLHRNLFTVDELESVSDYADYQRKERFLRNFYPMRYRNVSAWFIGTDAERAARDAELKNMYLSPVTMSYFDDIDTVKEITSLYATLTTAENRLKDSAEYWKAAFLSEMYNHEYGINWQGDFDVISAFANVNCVTDYENVNDLFSAAGFTDVQRRAYAAARAEYMSTVEF